MELCRNCELENAVVHNENLGYINYSKRERRKELEMATSYMDASEAANEALEFLVDVCGEGDILNELFDYMNVDRQVEFVHDFIKYHDVDMAEMNDDTLRTIEEHYKRHC